MIWHNWILQSYQVTACTLSFSIVKWKKVAIEINILPTWKLAWQNVYKSPVIPIIVTAAGKHNIQYCTFKRGFLKNSNALQKSYRDTWHSIIRASAKLAWVAAGRVTKSLVYTSGFVCLQRRLAPNALAEQWKPKWSQQVLQSTSHATADFLQPSGMHSRWEKFHDGDLNVKKIK